MLWNFAQHFDFIEIASVAIYLKYQIISGSVCMVLIYINIDSSSSICYVLWCYACLTVLFIATIAHLLT